MTELQKLLLTDSEIEKFNDFKKDHIHCPHGFDGAQYVYTYIPTGLGDFIECKCSCGAAISTFDGVVKIEPKKIPTLKPKCETDIKFIEAVKDILKRPKLYIRDGSVKEFKYYLLGLESGYQFAYDDGLEIANEFNELIHLVYDGAISIEDFSNKILKHFE